MKKILITCLGHSLSYDFIEDFKKKDDIVLYIGDMDSDSQAKLLTDNFILTLSGSDPNYSEDLLASAKKLNIDMIIPGADEEALALISHKKKFESEGIVLCVQPEILLNPFQSKTTQYDYLKEQGLKIPENFRVNSISELEAVLSSLNYKNNPILIKPNSGRGGQGIILLTESECENKDNLDVMNLEEFKISFNRDTEYIFMKYLDGIIYDVDILKYKNNDIYFGIRKRFTNVTKKFNGNVFDFDNAILEYSKKVYECFPTDYLIDYDLMVESDGTITLLEINPRPSGSTVSYIPFGYNLYYILAKSYLYDEHFMPNSSSLNGKYTKLFKTMVASEKSFISL